MQAERLVEFVHQMERHGADEPTDTLDRDGTHLLGLRFRVEVEADLVRRQQCLERVDVLLK